MNLTVLQYFQTVCDAGSFSKAAEQICISRQALSKSILSLEEQVGDRLFIRKKNGIEMTHVGETLYLHSKELLHNYEKLVKDLEKSKSFTKKPLRIGYDQLTYNLFNPSHMQAFTDAYPNVELHCEILHPQQLIQRLKAGHLDLIVTNGHWNDGDLVQHHVMSLPFCALVLDNDPLAQKNAIGADDLAVRNVYIRPIPGLFEHDRECFRKIGINANPLPTPSLDPMTVLNTIRHVKGVFVDSKLHQIYRNILEGLTIVPLSDDFPPELKEDNIHAILRKDHAYAHNVKYVQYLIQTSKIEKRKS